MSGQTRFAAGERVTVEIDGQPVTGVFVRFAARDDGVNVKSAAASREASAGIGWVRRSDTGEVEPFDYQLISRA
jgi:hypothetical protein